MLQRAPPAGKPPKHRPFRQFLDFDRQVLRFVLFFTYLSIDIYSEKKYQPTPQWICRFYGYWDDRDSEFGVIHNLEIHYFLGDDTMEIKEAMPANSGVEAAPMFLKRMRLPRVSLPYSFYNVATKENIQITWKKIFCFSENTVLRRNDWRSKSGIVYSRRSKHWCSFERLWTQSCSHWLRSIH